MNYRTEVVRLNCVRIRLRIGSSLDIENFDTLPVEHNFYTNASPFGYAGESIFMFSTPFSITPGPAIANS